jgi:hypothetical protein
MRGGYAGTTSLDVIGRDSAYIAMRLRNQQVGMQFSNQFQVNVIRRLARPEASSNFCIDLPARYANIKRRTAAGRKLPYPIGVIAFMRTPYEHFTSIQGTNDFSGARQERNNPHVMQPAAPVGRGAGRPRNRRILQRCRWHRPRLDCGRTVPQLGSRPIGPLPYTFRR